MERFFLQQGEITLTLIYDIKNKTVRIGGHKRNMSVIEDIISDYLEAEIPRAKFDRNKIRYKVKGIKKATFNTARLRLEAHHVVFIWTKNLGRVSR